MNVNAHSQMPESIEECKKLFKLTRDFDLYLDMLNRLKNKYLIILCLKNTFNQSFSNRTAEKIQSLGFSGFDTKSDMKYVGVLNNGSVLLDSLTGAYELPLIFNGDVPGNSLSISFDEKEGEIKINGKNQSLNDKGINIVVCDPKKSEVVDACSYDATEANPTFFHRNFYYSDKYIDSHIYIPESYKETVTLPMRRSYFSPRSLGVREVERGIFLPNKSFKVQEDGNKHENLDMLSDKHKEYGGICDESFNLIAGHQLLDPVSDTTGDRHISGTYVVEPEKITYIDETVLYGGTLIEHPGHLITECFADRLWWIAENPDSDIKIAIQIIWSVSDWTTGVDSFVMEFLEAFGISKDRLIVVETPTQFKKIIVPDQSSIPLNYCFPYDFTSQYIKPFQHITKRLTPGKYKKIYLSKGKLHNKSTIGEEYFIDFFEKKGFAIINPEDYTIKEKAELMYGADEVVTVDGTNSLFTVFCKPSVRLTLLTRRMDYWGYPQQLVTEALGIKEFFLVNISGSFLDQFSGNAFGTFSRGLTLTYATREFKKYVKYVYNEELDVAPEDSLKKYLFDYLTYFPEYYSDSIHFHNGLRFVKITDVLRSVSEVFLGKPVDTKDLVLADAEDFEIRRLKELIRLNSEASEKKIVQLTEKAKEFIEENAALKSTLSQREAEIEQLRRSNAEMSAYMAEISQLLDSLESGNGSVPEE